MGAAVLLGQLRMQLCANHCFVVTIQQQGALCTFSGLQNLLATCRLPVRRTLDTVGNNIVKEQSFHLVYLNIIMHKITNLWTFWAQYFGCQSCEIIKKEKSPLSHEVVCFQMLDFETSKSKIWGLEIKCVKNYFFLENYVTSPEGAVPHIVLYHQQLSLHYSLPTMVLC